MANEEVIKKLLKIAERQQKIIEKLAQQVMPTPKATVADFEEILNSVKTAPGSGATRITSAEALSDGSYDIKISGSLTSPEMQAFVQQASAKWTSGDKTKLRITRSMDMPHK